MSWAAQYIKMLDEGQVIQIRPHGGSVKGIIESGQLVTIEPIGTVPPDIGDVVLCKVHGRQYLHIVKSVGSDGRFLIGNNRGHINGWCSAAAIYGRVIEIGK